MRIKDFDIVTINNWQCPNDNGVPLLTMPNIPKPLHGLNPRTLMGEKEWEIQRAQCYARAHNTCEICGYELANLQAHEVYSYDFASCTGVYKRLVAVCGRCHMSIHSGRFLTLAKNGDISLHCFYGTIEHCFRLIYAYNSEHEIPLRVSDVILNTLRFTELEPDRLVELVKKYNIKFYHVQKPPKGLWPCWKLLWGNRVMRTPYKNEKEWCDAMKLKAEHDYLRKNKDMTSAQAM